MEMKLTPNERLLLYTMRRGTPVIVRAVTGRASYSGGEHGGDYDCTNALLGLFEKKLVKVEKIDKRAGWVWYIPTTGE